MSEPTTPGPKKPLPPTLDELAAQVRESEKRVAEEKSGGSEDLSHSDIEVIA